jgi:hypothetical protein
MYQNSVGDPTELKDYISWSPSRLLRSIEINISENQLVTQPIAGSDVF